MRLRSFRCWCIPTLIALVMLTALLSVPTPSFASSGDEDGRYTPPDRSQFDGHGGINRESSLARSKRANPDPVGEQGALGEHMDQGRINSGEASFDEIFKHGAHLFQAQFNKFDGQGRPLMTSGGVLRAPFGENYFRTGGPDTSSCWQCHNLPRSGGGGDFNALMFSGLHAKDPPEFSTTTNLTNHRAGPSVFGNGPLEMLAREMSFEMAAIRSAAKAEAALSGVNVTKNLVTKGVSFGSITATPAGKIDPSNIQGVDWDLIVKPHTLKGTGVSLRGFSTGGSFLHLGMQPVERFGTGDPDGDGVSSELTLGDVTALTVWMAALPVPGRVIPRSKGRAAAMVKGEQLFGQIGCATCHTPSMTLDNPVFSEPNPFNGAGMLKVSDLTAIGAQPYTFDLTRQGPGPRPERTRDGRATIRAFTDLKRHNITDVSGKLSEEQIPGGTLRGTAPASDFTVTTAPNLAVNVFMTEKLWDVGNTAPYGHRGDLSTFAEAIAAHGGEAASTRAAYNLLTQDDKDCITEFLRSMQIVPVDAPRITDQGDSIR